jgi:hypothetical protein
LIGDVVREDERKYEGFVGRVQILTVEAAWYCDNWNLFLCKWNSFFLQSMNISDILEEKPQTHFPAQKIV